MKLFTHVLKRLFLSTFLLSIATLTTMAPGWAESKFEAAGISNDKIVTEFVSQLKQQVTADDRAGIAAMVDYPISVHAQGKELTFKNSKEFLAKYDQIVNEHVKSAIKNKSGDLSASWRGVMLGNGELWLNLNADSHKLKITGINPE